VKVLFAIAVTIVFISGWLFFSSPSACGADCAASQTISVAAQEFAQHIQEPEVIILDVRTPEEFAAGHIENAINVDFNNPAEFQATLATLDKQTEYAIYCRSGNRSGQAMEIMREQGFSSITNLSDGIIEWQASGLQLVQ